MIQKLSHNISLYLCHELNYSNEKHEVLSYGIQIFLGISIKIFSIIAISYIFSIFKSTMIALSCFILFRRIIGGSHCNAFNKCFFLSVSLMCIAGALGKLLVMSRHLLFLLTVTTYILGTAITIIWVPRGTKKKLIRNKRTRLRIKIKTFFMLTTYVITLLYFEKLELVEIIQSSLFAIILAFFLATPLGNKLTDI